MQFILKKKIESLNSIEIIKNYSENYRSIEKKKKLRIKPSKKLFMIKIKKIL